jgi:hypothetical protein
VESAAVRAASLDVAARLGAVTDRWLVLGADPLGTRSLDGPGHGTFLGYGVDVRVSLTPDATGEPRPDLPLSVLIAGWLRGRAAAGARASAQLVDPALGADDCAALGERLAASAGTGVLVVGDGATTHTDKAPGFLDERAGPFDAEVAAALAGADPDRLLALDQELASELNAVGRAPWQVLAGLARAAGSGWRGELLYSGAPFGVAYHVAFWSRGR